MYGISHFGGLRSSPCKSSDGIFLLSAMSCSGIRSSPFFIRGNFVIVWHSLKRNSVVTFLFIRRNFGIVCHLLWWDSIFVSGFFRRILIYFRHGFLRNMINAGSGLTSSCVSDGALAIFDVTKVQGQGAPLQVPAVGLLYLRFLKLPVSLLCADHFFRHLRLVDSTEFYWCSAGGPYSLRSFHHVVL